MGRGDLVGPRKSSPGAGGLRQLERDAKLIDGELAAKDRRRLPADKGDQSQLATCSADRIKALADLSYQLKVCDDDFGRTNQLQLTSEDSH